MEDKFILSRLAVDDRIIQKIASNLGEIKGPTDVENLFVDFEQELFQIQKFDCMLKRQQKELEQYEALLESTEVKIQSATSLIEERLKEIQHLEAKYEKDQKYDLIAKKINKYAKVSTVEAEIEEVNKEITKLQEESRNFEEKYNELHSKASDWAKSLDNLLEEFV